MRCTKFFFQTEVVKNQNLQLLCYVIFFDILHHYGVIAASQICSVSSYGTDFFLSGLISLLETSWFVDLCFPI